MEPTTAIITLVIIIISLFWVIIFQKKTLNILEEENKKYKAYENQTTGLWATDKTPTELFYNAMQFTSDASPFDAEGECLMKDGFKHCEDSWQTYATAVFFKLGDTKKEFKNDPLPDYKQAPKPPR